MPSTILETERLILRELAVDDAPFILTLLNDPSWLRFIGDKGVRTLDDARAYIERGPKAMYAREGFGLWLTALKVDDTPIGLCGLIKRDTLEDVDIGFAYLPAYVGQGLAYEAAAATLAHGRDRVGLDRIVAITAIDNIRSIRLLERIGLTFVRRIPFPPDGEEVNLFGVVFQPVQRSAL
ncbi:GNAT family N-acetyltransferase [Aliidongia dinghuensis]|nr:GNAT family N-acetyltransferase [Aliidongia dinghuensis]